MTDKNIRAFRVQPIGDKAERFQPMLLDCMCIDDGKKTVYNASENPYLTPCGFWHRSGETLQQHFGGKCTSGYCTADVLLGTGGSMHINPEASNWVTPTYGMTADELLACQVLYDARCQTLKRVYGEMQDHLEEHWNGNVPKAKYYMTQRDHEVLRLRPRWK